MTDFRPLLGAAIVSCAILGCTGGSTETVEPGGTSIDGGGSTDGRPTVGEDRASAQAIFEGLKAYRHADGSVAH